MWKCSAIFQNNTIHTCNSESEILYLQQLLVKRLLLSKNNKSWFSVVYLHNYYCCAPEAPLNPLELQLWLCVQHICSNIRFTLYPCPSWHLGLARICTQMCLAAEQNKISFCLCEIPILVKFVFWSKMAKKEYKWNQPVFFHVFTWGLYYLSIHQLFSQSLVKELKNDHRFTYQNSIVTT